jgi:hypothetical protein
MPTVEKRNFQLDCGNKSRELFFSIRQKKGGHQMFCTNCGTKALTKSSNEAVASNEMITEEVHKHEQPTNLEDNPAHYHEQSANPKTYTSFSQSNPSDEELVKRFIGKNSDYYLKKWSSSKNPEKRSGMNWAAFFFNVIWLAYRKMYKYAFVYIGIWLVGLWCKNFIYDNIVSNKGTE